MTARGAIGVRGTPRAPVDAPPPDGVVEVPAGHSRSVAQQPR